MLLRTLVEESTPSTNFLWQVFRSTTPPDGGDWPDDINENEWLNPVIGIGQKFTRIINFESGFVPIGTKAPSW